MTPTTPQESAKREISAGLIVYRRTRGGVKFLLLYHGGRYWNFPKGHIEAEEKSLETAIRETIEETGLRRADLRIENRFKAYEKYTFFKGKTRIFKIVIFYIAKTNNRQVRVSEEHDGFAWFTYKEAHNILRGYRDSMNILNKANNFIKRLSPPPTSQTP